jgi:hypothetical protein
VDHGISLCGDAGSAYEYARREGKYAMTNTLGGARKSEAEAAAKK